MLVHPVAPPSGFQIALVRCLFLGAASNADGLPCSLFSAERDAAPLCVQKTVLALETGAWFKHIKAGCPGIGTELSRNTTVEMLHYESGGNVVERFWD